MEIETHGIDFVPLAERYGSARRLFTVWFSSNMTILGVALGGLGIQAGLSLGWTLVALAVGNAVGTVFMAAHSAQGPQLGVPQMIQSRAQFGVRGAALPLLAVVVTYVLYCSANAVLIQSVIRSIWPVSVLGALTLFSGLTVLVAFIGYELIHRLGAILTVISTVLFAAAAILLWNHQGAGLMTGTLPVARFSGAAFMLTATQAASWSLSYGPYVADYSRYLPPSVPPAKTFWYTAAGCFSGSLAIMAFGAYLCSVEPTLAKDPGTGLAAVFGPARPLVQVLMVLGVLQGNVLNLYSAYMSSVTIFSGMRGSRNTGRVRKLLIMSGLMLTAGIIAAVARDNFQAHFSDALNIMLYLLVPWSAINLADYYFVRQGQYNIDALYSARCEYGAYRWKTIGVFCVGVVIQVPFMQLSFFQGAIAAELGCDIAWLPGLLLPGLIYIIAGKRLGAETIPRFSG